MYVEETMERTEYRRNRRAAVREQQKARRRMFIILCLTLVAMFGIGVGFGTLLTRAEEPVHSSAYKYYANVEIQSGDTLWSLADEYMDTLFYMDKKEYINEVMEINSMVTDHLISGQKIILPYYSSEIK